MISLFQSVIFLICVHLSIQSIGDRSPYFQKCLEKCNLDNCTDDGLLYKSKLTHPSRILWLFQWTCDDECSYECMWKTITAFEKRNWHIPQFYGKWPFYRFLGLREPASVLFSLLNLYNHLRMLKKFRYYIKSDYPLYYLWHVFTAVCVNAWIWSSVFHARDTVLTEILDYSSAFSIILVSCYCMVFRILYKTPRYLLVTITTFFVALLFNHIMYLSIGKINYAYNMQLNITIGGLTAIGWFFWCAWNRYRQPYTWKCAAFVSLTALCTLFEVTDHPPIFFIIDCHAMWHFSSAQLMWLFYDFIIDDCKFLKKLEASNAKKLIIKRIDGRQFLVTVFCRGKDTLFDQTPQKNFGL